MNFSTARALRPPSLTLLFLSLRMILHGFLVARRLAEFLLFQQKETGEFLSKYYYIGTENEVFESLYYPGESILALTRLYQIDPDPVWLNAAMKGADWLILTRDASRNSGDLSHDHWLLTKHDRLGGQNRLRPAQSLGAVRPLLNSNQHPKLVLYPASCSPHLFSKYHPFG